jgi:hypothetical protein
VFGEPAPIDIERELAALRAEVAAIRAQWSGRWLDEARAEEIRGLVREALAEPDARRSFRSDGWTAGYDGGAFVRSADGSWSVKANVMLQTRFVAASAFGAPGSRVVEQTRWGFETRRVNVGLSGTAIDPSIRWLALFSDQSQPDRFIVEPNSFRPLYAWIRKDLGGGLSTTVGLQNVPWDLESDFFGSSRLTTGDYSVFNYRFGAGKQPGVTVQYQGDALRTTVGVFTQFNSRTLAWDDPQQLSFAVSGRAELKWGAQWAELDWESSRPGDTPGVVAGLAVCWTGARGTNPQPPVAAEATPAAAGFTADIRAALAGATLIGQYALMRDAVGAAELGWNSGIGMQGAYFVAPAIEAFAEASWSTGTAVPWIAQAGFNVYFDAKALKLTLKSIVPFGAGDVNGIRPIAGGLGIAQQDNNASFVAQMQMSF